MAVHNLMARALIDVGRESDARIYLDETLKQSPENGQSLDLEAESHVHGPFRRYLQAFKPVTPETCAELYKTIDDELAAMEKLPTSVRNSVAEAELHHLYYMIKSEEVREATAAENAAEISLDASALEKARQQLADMKDPAGPHEEKALSLLKSAMAADAKNSRAASLLAEYLYGDRRYPESLAVYEQQVKLGDVPRELALTAANVMIVDTARQGDRLARFADAQKVLEGYLKDNPRDARTLVAMGQVMLEQNNIEGRTRWRTRRNAARLEDLDGEILLINCRLREREDSGGAGVDSTADERALERATGLVLCWVLRIRIRGISAGRRMRSRKRWR